MHLLVRGYDCYESPFQSAGEPIRWWVVAKRE